MADIHAEVSEQKLTPTPITSFFAADEIARRPKVESVTGLACSTIYEQMKKGTFPKPIKLGERAVGWRMSEINAWLEQRIAEREGVQ